MKTLTLTNVGVGRSTPHKSVMVIEGHTRILVIGF